MNARIASALEHTDPSASSARGTALGRIGILAYGIASYTLGVAALVSLVLVMLGVLPFTGGPVHIETSALAVLFDVGLLAAFGLQHSLMARSSFKERWTRVIPPAMERSTYVLATGLVLLPVLLIWQPLPTVLWSVDSPLGRGALTGIAVLGWAYLFVASFAINHFELFGLQQAWRAFRGLAPTPVPFRERWMYRFDRHPIMTGVLVGLWVTPDMTVGRLLFAAASSTYVVIGVHFEERSLRRQLGDPYEAYRRRVGTIVPLRWSR
jgi:protein-S-isoprenylcysteine O-methyltransferase Ste14